MLYGRSHFARALETLLALLLQRAHHHVIDARIERRALRWWGEATDGQFAGEQFVEDDAERINVRAMIDGGRFFKLLRGHVVWRAERRAGGGERDVGFVVAHDFRDTEVGDLHAPLRVEQDVLGLDVAVENAFLVGELERLTNLRHDGQRLGGREASSLHGLAQVHTVHVFHQQIVEAARLPKVEDADDVRMVQPRERAALAIETLGEVRVVRERVRQQLERDEAVEVRLAGLEHEAHAAAPDQFNDLELGKGDGEAFERGNLRRGGRRGFRSGCRGEHALRAKALRRFGRHGRAALGTGVA